MDKKNPLVSIVVLNWNGLEDTKQCLNSLGNLSYENIEIILVDNGSTDGSKSYFSSVKIDKYIDNPTNKGFTGGHIDGYRASSGEYILLLNNDAIVSSDIIKVALEEFKDQSVSAVGGRLFHWKNASGAMDESLPFYSYQEISPFSGEAHTKTDDMGVTQEVNNVSGACLFVRRSVIEQVGYLEDSFFAYYEECDLIARMKRAGYKVLYTPKIKLWHKDGASTKDNPYFFYYMMFRNRFYFAVRNFDKYFLLRFYKSYYRSLLRSIIRFVIYRKPQDRAQSKAGFSATLKLPKLLIQRYKIKRRLMPRVSYNQKIAIESSRVSLILKEPEKSLSLLPGNLKNYIPLVSEVVAVCSKSFHAKPPSHKAHNLPLEIKQTRLVSDGLSDISLGALVSSGEYIVICEGNLSSINTDKLMQTVAAMAKFGIDFGCSGVGPKLSFVCATRHSYVKVGGADTAEGLIRKVIEIKQELVVASEKAPFIMHRKNFLAKKISKVLKRASSKFGNIGLISKLRKFVKWLLFAHIGIWQKAQTCTRVFYYGITFNRKHLVALARQVDHELSLGTLDKYLVLDTKEKIMNVPIFIISRDRYSYLINTVKWLKNYGLNNLYVLDNASAFPPLLKYFRECKLQVINFGKNYGQTVPWDSGALELIAKNKYFVITDPDLEPTENLPPDFMSVFYNLLIKYPEHAKTGFSLKIDDVPDHYPLKKSVKKWESQFWKDEIEPGVFEAGVDTTFALYKPNIGYVIHPALRVNYPYSLKHLPWYVNPRTIDEEDLFYRKHLDKTVNSWDTGELHERYEKEMKKLNL